MGQGVSGAQAGGPVLSNPWVHGSLASWCLAQGPASSAASRLSNPPWLLPQGPVCLQGWVTVSSPQHRHHCPSLLSPPSPNQGCFWKPLCPAFWTWFQSPTEEPAGFSAGRLPLPPFAGHPPAWHLGWAGPPGAAGASCAPVWDVVSPSLPRAWDGRALRSPPYRWSLLSRSSCWRGVVWGVGNRPELDPFTECWDSDRWTYRSGGYQGGVRVTPELSPDR